MDGKGDSESISGERSETTIHVRQAIAGSPTSASWVIEHFSPLLLAQAKYRLRRHLDGLHDAEDLVQHVWLVSLPKLAAIVPRNGRFTPPLLKFLSSVLHRRYQELLRSRIARVKVDAVPADNASELADSITGPASAVLRGERVEALERSLDGLSEADREIIVLRGIEQLPYVVLAAKCGAAEGTLMVRYHRALERLGKLLPPCIAEEMRLSDPAC